MPKVNCKLIHTRKYSINYACISFSLFVAYIRIIISKWRNKNISENNLYETVRTSKQMRRKKERRRRRKEKLVIMTMVMNNKKATQSKMREREKMNNGSKKENRRQNKRSECI